MSPVRYCVHKRSFQNFYAAFVSNNTETVNEEQNRIYWLAHHFRMPNTEDEDKDEMYRNAL